MIMNHGEPSIMAGRNTAPLNRHSLHLSAPAGTSSGKPPQPAAKAEPRTNRLHPDLLLGCLQQVVSLFQEQHPTQTDLLVARLESLVQLVKVGKPASSPLEAGIVATRAEQSKLNTPHESHAI